ncbi:MAG TPA: cytochrome c [Gemmatimonadaceae bacterium]|nr:cytochrome c [Gemmatimonadaceae bacterium]
MSVRLVPPAPRSPVRLLRACAGASVLALGGCEWFTDFKRQPSISTWEQIGDSTVASRTNPSLSIPTTGMLVAGYQVSYAPLPAVVDSMSGLANPVPADAQSLERGHRYFQINCAVCHGDAGAGDGPASRYGMPGINIVTEVSRARSDGYLWGIIRNGRGIMPNYNRIPELDRWDVVNYLRALQSATPGVATGAIAEPGVTGTALPGATRLAPTRPPPYWGHPGRPETGGAGGAAAAADATSGDTAVSDAPAAPRPVVAPAPSRPPVAPTPAPAPPPSPADTGAGVPPDTGGRQ